MEDMYRTEHDLVGEMRIEEKAYYGIHSLRAAENFPITGRRLPGTMIESLAWIKKACARANRAAGVLAPETDEAIERACDEIIAGALHDQFIVDPLQGKVLAQADIPDETFAQGILGPGCGIEPTGDTVYAPFDGTVTQIATTLHAVGITSNDGIELLIHVGMDTVDMKGQGFTALVKENQKVTAGTPLLKVDLDAIRAAGHPTATAIIVTDGAGDAVEMLAEGDVAPGTPLFKV